MGWRIKSLKASALQFAILLSVIVALLLSSFLLFTFTHRTFSVRADQVIENIESAEKGIRYGFNNEINSDPVSIHNIKVPVILEKTYLGSFELLSSTAGTGLKSIRKIALLGSNPAQLTGLWLQDNHLPLVLVGDTRVEGDAYIPENIVKPGSISGNYYQGKELIYGKRFNSRQKLPELDKEWRKYITEILGPVTLQDENLESLKDLANSFQDKRIMIFQPGKIFIDHTLKGNIIIKSQTAIEVSSFSRLDQVLLIAPKVIFKENFEGTVHVIAGEIRVEKNSKIFYPSSMVVQEENPLYEETSYSVPKIILGENSLFQGNIIYLNSNKERKTTKDVLLRENSLVEGTVYNEGYSEIKGTILGSIYSRYFVANQSGSVYINHIYNAKILTDDVKPQICGVLLEEERKNIALWLY